MDRLFSDGLTTKISGVRAMPATGVVRLGVELFANKKGIVRGAKKEMIRPGLIS